MLFNKESKCHIPGTSLWTRHPHSTALSVPFLIPTSQMRKLRFRSIKSLLKVTQLVRGRARTCTHTSLAPSLVGRKTQGGTRKTWWCPWLELGPPDPSRRPGRFPQRLSTCSPLGPQETLWHFSRSLRLSRDQGHPGPEQPTDLQGDSAHSTHSPVPDQATSSRSAPHRTGMKGRCWGLICHFGV